MSALLTLVLAEMCTRDTVLDVESINSTEKYAFHGDTNVRAVRPGSLDQSLQAGR